MRAEDRDVRKVKKEKNYFVRVAKMTLIDRIYFRNGYITHVTA